MTGSALEFHACSPSEPLVLGDDEAHVWRVDLNQPGSSMQAMKQTLTVEERTRASRFRFSTDRNRFIAARATLRAILGRYLHRDPPTLRFAYNGYGKPLLIEEFEDGPIFFNVTHSQGLALYAFTRMGDVGIDLEQVTAQGKDYEDIARRFFSAAEIKQLLAVPAEHRQEAFLNGWTRKEAYVKARGLGLSLELRQFDVALTPGEPAALLANREADQEHAPWSLYELTPGPGFIAALAVKGSISALRCWNWPA